MPSALCQSLPVGGFEGRSGALAAAGEVAGVGLGASPPPLMLTTPMRLQEVGRHLQWRFGHGRQAKRKQLVLVET